jgi:hypothetical protein
MSKYRCVKIKRNTPGEKGNKHNAPVLSFWNTAQTVLALHPSEFFAICAHLR